MKITMIGHSSVLIETKGMRILTDPFFGLKGNLVYSRVSPPAQTRDSLLDVDLVLVSHNHFDHTDSQFFRKLPASTPVVAPSLSSWVTKLKGARNIVKIKPWQQLAFGSLSIIATPAWHSTVTHGFILKLESTIIYFAADTYYASFMRRIASEFHPDVVIMPVTTFRIPLTMGESGALSAARVLKPKVIIPIHLGIVPRNPLLRTSQRPESFAQKLAQIDSTVKVEILREGSIWSN